MELLLDHDLPNPVGDTGVDLAAGDHPLIP
jgi:hypothetical protein